jgi:uncharacterized protein DUF1996
MRSRFPTRRADLVAPLLASLLTLAACAERPASAAVEHAAPDQVLAGPQGSKGQFVVECDLDHLGSDDPIVHPGHAGMSHLHQFFGAVGVDANSQPDDLERGATTCEQSADTAAYWAPVLLNDGEPVRAIRSVAYYRAGPGVAPQDVSDFPDGLMLVGGDADATSPQSPAVAAWSCGTGSVRSATPLDCSDAPSLRMLVTYPDCWNGTQLAASDWHDPSKRHAVYSEGGICPNSYPVHIPQLQFAIDYSPVPADELADLTLSSGDIHSAHADFWNTWDQDKLRHEVAQCIRRDLVCNVTSSKRMRSFPSE